MKLSELKSPQEISLLSQADIKELAQDIRAEIIRTVSQNGGHLSSNLGVVELTLALYKTFDFEQDQLVWDVGHQCYAHKLLTGRYQMFSTLRKTDGICGFPRSEESKYDLFNTGHSSTALSSALGLARARDAKGEKHHVVAVVGDGALTGGMCYEALNDIGSSETPLIMVLNDNGMSISGNVGALSNYLTYMRVSKGWQGLKKAVSGVLKRIPVLGQPMHDLFLHFKDHVRNVFVKDTFFSSLGFRYLGPIDGHDVQAMERVLRRAGEMNEPVVVHVMTRKGEGFKPAEEKPETYHGTPPFDLESGEMPDSGKRTFGEAASAYLTKLARQDERLVVVTAAMTYGTGFASFAEKYPNRIVDVGIAEEHAVTMAGGMAKGGLRPVVAIYDTFMQRAYDQIMEDVCAQHLPVLMLLDRAGIGGEDGASHHGMFGSSFLSTMPGLTVLYPRCVGELECMIDWALSQNEPVAIRYPKSEEKNQPPYSVKSFCPGRWEVLREGKDACILAVGAMCTTALGAADRLAEEGIHVRVIHASSVNRLDEHVLTMLHQGHIPFFTLEENAFSGGFGSMVAAHCAQHGLTPPSHIFALPDAFIPHGKREVLLARCALDTEQVAQFIKTKVKA